jgi:hypothetical protein
MTYFEEVLLCIIRANLLMVAGAGSGEIYHSLSPFLGDQQIL